MPIDRPSSQQIEKIAGDLGMKLSAEELESYRQLLSDSFASYDRIDELTEPKLVNGYSRPKGERAAASENPYNAWYWKSTVNGADSGPLKGKKIALKDNICLAGVPMMNGAQVLDRQNSQERDTPTSYRANRHLINPPSFCLKLGSTSIILF